MLFQVWVKQYWCYNSDRRVIVLIGLLSTPFWATVAPSKQNSRSCSPTRAVVAIRGCHTHVLTLFGHQLEIVRTVSLEMRGNQNWLQSDCSPAVV